MTGEERKLYIGLEIGADYVMISSFTEGMAEPETISRVNGSGFYLIPMALLKKSGVGQWYYGEEALRMAEKGSGTLLADLYRKGIAGEKLSADGEEYDAEDIFALFLRKVLLLPRRLGSEMEIGKLAVTFPELNAKNADFMERMLQKNGLEQGQYLLLDNRESFYYYALNQKPEQWLHDVVLFDCMMGHLKALSLSRNTKTVPQMITIEEKDYGMLYDDKDAMFEEYIRETFRKRIVSTSYLVGDGFDGEWMKESLKELCRGKKAFLGRNLYTKGACYGAMVKSGVIPWNFVYMGDNELKLNVSLKVHEKGEMAFYSLLSAGESWYEAVGECEVILSGSPEIDFWLQEPDSREAKIQSMVLTDFPERENKTSRLRITAKPVSDKEISVEIKDLGFGEFVRSSGKTWKYIIKEP